MDHLEVIRKRLAAMPSREKLRLAVDAEVSPRTLENIIAADKDVYYGTVMKIYQAMQAQEKKGKKK